MPENEVLAEPKFLSTQECANRMDVSKGLVIREIEKGILPAIRVGSGRIFRIKETDFNAYLEARRTVQCLEPTPK